MDEKNEKLLKEMEEATNNIADHLEKGAEKTKEIVEQNIASLKDTGNELKEKLEEALHKNSEKAPVKESKETLVKDTVSNGEVELKLEGMKTVEDAKQAFRKKYGYDTEKGADSNIELKKSEAKRS